MDPNALSYRIYHGESEIVSQVSYERGPSGCGMVTIFFHGQAVEFPRSSLDWILDRLYDVKHKTKEAAADWED